MSSPHERHRNNVKAGVFMAIAILLALSVIAVLTETWSSLIETRASYALTFPVRNGVQSLTTGSKVRVGGIEVGEVTGVSLVGAGADSEDSQQAFDRVRVLVAIDDDVPIYSNARAFIRSPLIGADSWIEFTSIGNETDGTLLKPDNPSQALRGRSSGSFLASMLGQSSADNVEQIVADIAEFTPFLANIEQTYQKEVLPILDNIEASSIELKQLVSTIAKDDWPRWSERVDSVLVNVDRASVEIDRAVSEAKSLIEEGRRFVANMDEGVTNLRQVIDRNTPAFETTLANVRDASEDVAVVTDRVREETVDKVHTLLEQGQTGVESFAKLGEDLQTEFAVLAPRLRDALASTQIAANELALGITEIRHSPHRLLYRPSADKLAYENLYFAASKFALAAAELKVATQSIERSLSSHGAYLQENPEVLRRIQENLAESFERYQNAQRQLLDILGTTSLPEGK